MLSRPTLALLPCLALLAAACGDSEPVIAQPSGAGAGGSPDQDAAADSSAGTSGQAGSAYVFSGRMTTSCWSHGCEVWVPTLSG
jgi:hypothetical protein